jgi:hypothetical protein
VRALYWERPAAAAVGVIGLRPEDFTAPSVDVWPENWPALKLFTRIATQWRTGAAGPVGLDYTVVYREMDRLKLDEGEQDEMMAAIRVIEVAALRAMRESD